MKVKPCEWPEGSPADKCPNCGKPLKYPPGGGVACTDKKCGWWFCY